MVIGDVPVLSAQFTVRVPVPLFVLGPMVHVHDAKPATVVVLGSSPAATLTVPAGVVYVIEHDVFGGPWIAKLAVPFAGAPFTLRKEIGLGGVTGGGGGCTAAAASR